MFDGEEGFRDERKLLGYLESPDDSLIQAERKCG